MGALGGLVLAFRPLRHCVRASAKTRRCANLACYALALVALGASPRIHLEVSSQVEEGINVHEGSTPVMVVAARGTGRPSPTARRTQRGPVAEERQASRTAPAEP